MTSTLHTYTISSGAHDCEEPECTQHPSLFVTDVSQKELEQHDAPAWIVASSKASKTGFTPIGDVRLVEIDPASPIPRDRVLSKDEVVSMGFDWDWLAL